MLNDYDLETHDFYRWTVDLTQEELKQLLADHLKMEIGDILDLLPLEKGPGGHISKLKIVGTECTFTIGKELEIRLDSVRITTNKNKVPNDPRPASETSGLRLGSPAVTSRGFKEDDMRLVGNMIADAVFDFDAKRKDILDKVQMLCDTHPIYQSKFKAD